MTTTLRNSTIVLMLIIQTFLPGKVFSQYVNFNIGPSFPVGKFASTDFSDDKAGYAGVGFNFNANFIFRHDVSIIALGGQLFYNQNDFKSGDLEKQFNTIVGPSYNAALNYPPSTYYTFSSLESWSSWGGMFGVYCYTSKNASLKGFGRAMFGFQSANSFSYSMSANNFFLKEESLHTINPILLLGAGVQFLSNESVSFKIGVDYLLSNPDYGTRTISNGSVSRSTGVDLKVPFAVLNYFVGVEIKLHNGEPNSTKQKYK